MKVYVLTTGCYSDYSIHSIYSTREKAQAVIDRYDALSGESPDGFNPIMEMELDQVTPDEFVKVFNIYFRKGTLNLAPNCSPDKGDTIEKSALDPVGGYRSRNRYVDFSTYHYESEPFEGFQNIVADDFQHAVKIASDLMREHRTLNKFGIGELIPWSK